MQGFIVFLRFIWASKLATKLIPVGQGQNQSRGVCEPMIEFSKYRKLSDLSTLYF